MKHELYETGTYLYLISKDARTCGTKRYTVWSIMLFGDNRTEVIGRELSLRVARGVIKGRLISHHMQQRPMAVRPEGTMAKGRRL